MYIRCNRNVMEGYVNNNITKFSKNKDITDCSIIDFVT